MDASAAILSASRTTAAPFCLFFSLVLLSRIWELYRQPDRPWGKIIPRILAGPFCFVGLGLYLLFIWGHFGEYGSPFELIPQIQVGSWGKFHHQISLSEFVSFKHLFVYWGDAFARDGFFMTDPKTTNLIWTTLAFISTVYGLCRKRHRVLTSSFMLYFFLIYYANAGSDYLISTHRFFVMMLPIYMMLADAHSWIETKSKAMVAHVALGVVLAANFAYYVIWLLYFSQGHWYYF